MSKRHFHFRPPYAPTQAPLVITIKGITAGLAVGDKHGFRFVAGHPIFDSLESVRFRRIEDMRTAALRLANAAFWLRRVSSSPAAENIL